MNPDNCIDALRKFGVVESLTVEERDTVSGVQITVETGKISVYVRFSKPDGGLRQVKNFIEVDGKWRVDYEWEET